MHVSGQLLPLCPNRAGESFLASSLASTLHPRSRRGWGFACREPCRLWSTHLQRPPTLAASISSSIGPSTPATQRLEDTQTCIVRSSDDGVCGDLELCVPLFLRGPRHARRDAMDRTNGDTNGPDGYSRHLSTSDKSSIAKFAAGRASAETECRVSSSAQLVRLCQQLIRSAQGPHLTVLRNCR